MRVVLMSGVPGSGKSSYVRKHYPDAMVLSTDDHHIDPDGVYRFKSERLGEFHDVTLRRFAGAMLNESEWVANNFAVRVPEDRVVVVDNTNVRMFEVAPFYRLAQACGHDVEIVRVYCDPDVAAARTLHGVPLARVREMAASFDPLPPWWKVKYVFPEGSINRTPLLHGL